MGVKRRSAWLASKRAMSATASKPAIRITLIAIFFSLFCFCVPASFVSAATTSSLITTNDLVPVKAAAVSVAANAARASTAAESAPASAAAKLVFRRVFKESTPEFIEIVVAQDSDKATYEIRQLEEDPEKLPFEVGAALRAKMFDLAGEMNHFQNQDLDVHRKIANLGEKTFRWEQGSEAHEVKFNYTLNTAATQLLQIFEGLARQQELVELLERRMKYDRLGINDALLQFETDMNKNMLPEPQRALPVLDQISGNPQFVEIARQRARTLAERIRRGSAAS
jgi:hypothetical protein